MAGPYGADVVGLLHGIEGIDDKDQRICPQSRNES